MVAVSQL